ncbi:MAG: hypothetical protein R3362_01620 [Rhodothermales bacterium]|nr:hypothetical protein [Rhodothermales bacterium]
MHALHRLSSLTRIAPLAEEPYTLRPLDHDLWATGDYVGCEVLAPLGSIHHLELPSGRMSEVAPGEIVIGALGRRYATLEATGTWEAVGPDDRMHILTGGGLVGRLTSKSPYVGSLLEVGYRGHVYLDGKRATMRRFVEPVAARPFTTPTVLIVASSMSAGKTTAARAITRTLKADGLRVVGAKLTGAGRYRDVLAVRDAGADWVYDFVDVGLPSTACPVEVYRPVVRELLARLAGHDADVAVVEIGSSPLEPYNGAAAIQALGDAVCCRVLCASDPYAAVGVMDAYGLRPDLVSGIATNTLAGLDLIGRLTGLRALNLMDPETQPELREILRRTLGLPAASREAEPAA